MSPRTRFRAEMARRGYGSSSTASPTSSDILFRLFQPSSSSGSNTAAGNSSGSGGNAFRGLFNLGGGGGGGVSSSHNHDLDSDLSSDEDEAHWNHNLNSLAQTLPFFLGMRGSNKTFIKKINRIFFLNFYFYFF